MNRHINHPIMRRTPLLYLPALCLFSFLIGHPSAAQPPDLSYLMTETRPSCADVDFNSKRLIPEYYERGQLDSVEVVLDYWQYHCGAIPQIQQTRMLLGIVRGDLTEDEIQLFTPVRQFRGWPHGPYGPYWQHIILYTPYYEDGMGRAREYREFLTELAENQAGRKDVPRFERYLAWHIAGETDSLYSAFRREEFPDSPLQTEYLEELEEIRRQGAFHAGIFAGIWMPTDSLEILGNHPEIGVLFGGQWSGFFFDLYTSFRFLKSANEYLYNDDDSTYVTDNYFSFGIGTDFGYRLLKARNHEFQLLGGIGYENFTVVPYDDDTETDAVIAGALNLSLGFNFRLYLKGDSYLGLRYRYNVLNYNSHGGSSLSGNAITVGMVYGWADNSMKRYRLQSLGVGLR